MKQLWILLVVLFVVVFFAGCGGKELEPRTTCTLTMEVEGEGTVMPDEGKHPYERNGIYELKAFPADNWVFKKWVGAVADTENEETTISMDGDQIVKAVFVTASAALPPARCQWVIEDGTVRIEFDAWNCSGLEGEWKWRAKTEIAGFGTLSGEGTFTMPPRPDSGEWDSLPFSLEFGGTNTVEGSTVEISNVGNDLVNTIIDLNEDPKLISSRGTVMIYVTVTAYGHTVERSDSTSWASNTPNLITFERHPECN